MEKLIFLVLGLVSLVNCNDFIVIKSPDSIAFKGTSEIPQNSIANIPLAALGYSVDIKESWDGMMIPNPFKVAKAAVLVVLEDAEDLKIDADHKFPLKGGDEDFEEVVHSKVADHSRQAFNIDLVHRHDDHILTAFGELKKSPLDTQPQFLKSKEKGTREFLDEIEYFQSLINAISSMESLPAFISVRLSMKSLAKTASARSEANKLLVATINKFNDAVQKKYDGNALFGVVTVEEHIPEKSHRIKRQAATAENNTNPYNIADLSNADYPVIFNIILWFSLVLIFTLIAISLALSNVEDKDSIIYRMTGARGKKDN